MFVYSYSLQSYTLYMKGAVHTTYDTSYTINCPFLLHFSAFFSFLFSFAFISFSKEPFLQIIISLRIYIAISRNRSRASSCVYFISINNSLVRFCIDLLFTSFVLAFVCCCFRIFARITFKDTRAVKNFISLLEI